MNTNIKNILFAGVNLPLLDRKQAAKEILELPDSVSWWDDYRYTKMIPLCTKNGDGNRKGTNNHRSGDFAWTNYTPNIIKNWFENIVFPWTGCRSRVMALITQPGIANHEHIDCNRNELNTQQHKFRIVLQGSVNTLYFITKQGNIYAPNIETPFIMDGSWAHGMRNTSNNIKVTLALGAPWTGNKEYNNIDILLEKNKFDMPDNLDSYWQK